MLECRFFDFWIQKKTPNGPGFLSFEPYIKPSARHVPLSSWSYHPEAVHRSWPVAEMVRMTRRSSTGNAGIRWREIKLLKFRRFFLKRCILSACAGWRARSGSVCAKQHLMQGRATEQPKIVRLILPFRRELRGLPSELRNLTKSWIDSLVIDTALRPVIQVSWSRAGCCLSNLFL